MFLKKIFENEFSTDMGIYQKKTIEGLGALYYHYLSDIEVIRKVRELQVDNRIMMLSLDETFLFFHSFCSPTIF